MSLARAWRIFSARRVRVQVGRRQCHELGKGVALAKGGGLGRGGEGGFGPRGPPWAEGIGWTARAGGAAGAPRACVDNDDKDSQHGAH